MNGDKLPIEIMARREFMESHLKLLILFLFLLLAAGESQAPRHGYDEIEIDRDHFIYFQGIKITPFTYRNGSFGFSDLDSCMMQLFSVSIDSGINEIGLVDLCE